MPEVSFYILKTDSEQQRLIFICKLVEKIYRSGESVYLYCDTEIISHKLDDLMWTFRAGSFIPHQLCMDNAPDQSNPVLIGASDAPENWRKNIINISHTTPKNISHSERVIEILDNTETCKQAGRARYRYYQQQNYNIRTHNIK